jgi:hypothetical protein
MPEHSSKPPAAQPDPPRKEPERLPAEALIEGARVYFDTTSDRVAAAIASGPANRVQFSVDEVKELLAEVEGTELSPYAGVADTYPVREEHA